MAHQLTSDHLGLQLNKNHSRNVLKQFKTDSSANNISPFTNRTNIQSQPQLLNRDDINHQCKGANNQQLFTMKSNNTELLDYSKTSQTDRSFASSRYNFRQIMSPLPKEDDECEVEYVEQMEPQVKRYDFAQSELANDNRQTENYTKEQIQSMYLKSQESSQRNSFNEYEKTTSTQYRGLSDNSQLDKQNEKSGSQCSTQQLNNFSDTQKTISLLHQNEVFQDQNYLQEMQNQLYQQKQLIHSQQQKLLHFQQHKSNPELQNCVNQVNEQDFHQNRDYNQNDDDYIRQEQTYQDQQSRVQDQYEKHRQFSFSEQKRRQSYDQQQINLFMNPNCNVVQENHKEKDLHQCKMSGAQDTVIFNEYGQCKDQQQYLMKNLNSRNAPLQKNQESNANSNSLIRLATQSSCEYFPHHYSKQSIQSSDTAQAGLPPKHSSYVNDYSQANIKIGSKRNSLTGHNDSITEKIKLLREDIQILFPTSSSRRNESASPQRQSIGCDDPKDNQTIQILPKCYNYPRSVERISRCLNKNNQSARLLVLPKVPQNKKTPERSKSKECLKSNRLQQSINKLTARITENINNNQVIVANKLRKKSSTKFGFHETEPLKLKQNLQKLNTGPYDEDKSELTLLKKEFQSLSTQLIQEKKNLKEYKERVTRRKEHEAQKYQSEIQQLKSELVHIESKYTKEVQRLEDQYNKYRTHKNSKFQRLLTELQEKYDRQLLKERELSKQLEIEMSEYKTKLTFYMNQSQMKVGSGSQKDIHTLSKKLEKQKDKEVKECKVEYDKKLIDIKTHFEKLIVEIKRDKKAQYEQDLHLQSEQLAVLEDENLKLRKILNYNEQLKNSSAQDRSCVSCYNLMITNEKLLDKLQRHTTSMQRKQSHDLSKSGDFSNSAKRRSTMTPSDVPKYQSMIKRSSKSRFQDFINTNSEQFSTTPLNDRSRERLHQVKSSSKNRNGMNQSQRDLRGHYSHNNKNECINNKLNY